MKYLYEAALSISAFCRRFQIHAFSSRTVLLTAPPLHMISMLCHAIAMLCAAPLSRS